MQPFRGRFKKGTGLKQGIILFSFFAIILPILAISLLFIGYHQRSTYAEINNENIRLAKAIRHNITTFLQSPISTVTAVARLSRDPEMRPHLDDMLAQMADSYGFYESIMLLDHKGIVRNVGTRKGVEINRGDVLGLDLSQSSHVAATSKSRQSVWSDTYISPLTGEPTLSLTFPAENGMVVGNFNLGELSRIVAPEQNKSHDRSFLVNSKGRIIAHQNRSRVLQQESVADLAIVNAGLSGDESVLEYEVGGVAKIGAVVIIPETGWLVVVERDYDEVFSSMRRMEEILVVALISMTLLVVLLLMYINSRVIKPIVAISRASQRVVDGSFAAPPEYRSRFIELKELATNFSAMVTAIEQRENELQDNNTELEQEIEERTRIEEALQERNEELASIEEELRTQVDKHIETHDQLLVTEEMLRIQLERAEESSQKFKAVFDNSPITVALTTLPDGRFYEVNQAFIDMFGYAREDAIGKTTLELGVWLHEDDRNRYLQLLKENRFVSNFEVEMRRNGGEKFAVFFSGAILDIAGKPFALSAVMDISEQKRLQNQLVQSQKLDIVGQLAGGIAHDFNNMLAVIMASAERLKQCLPSDEKSHKMISSIIEATARSADLTRELLSFSRKGSTIINPVHINDTIAAVISLLERTIDKQIRLEALLDADDPVVMGDQTQLQSALLNLGINARDAMPQGGVLTYSTAGKALDETACRSMGISLLPGYYLEIVVSDTGAGMTKAVMERIFEPFFTTKAVGKGTGLGLAAVYGTVRSHHGEMFVHSEPGVGSLFKIYLPMAEGEMYIPLASSEVLCGNGGILLVDDEEILREVGRELLETLGYKVYLAENGVHAVEVFIANQGDISLVVLDMIMPKMGGMETLLKLREQAPDVRVLLCSGYSHEGTGDELIGLGANGFIQKPYSLSTFSRAVAEAIG